MAENKPSDQKDNGGETQKPADNGGRLDVTKVADPEPPEAEDPALRGQLIEAEAARKDRQAQAHAERSAEASKLYRGTGA